MRVCLYSHAFWPSVGGIETVSDLLANYLHGRGVEVTVVTQTSANGNAEPRPYRVVRTPTAAGLAQVVAAQDLVHCNGMSIRGVFAAFGRGVPVIVTHQSYNAAVPHSLRELRKMLVNEGPRRIPHAVGSALGMHLAEINACISRFLHDRLRPPRGIVVYNPIGRSFRPLPDTERTDRFAFVGRLVADKGCDVLLRALAECGRRGYRYGLDVYGSGPEQDKLVALVRECGLSEQVKFHGSIRGEELAEAYNRSLAVVVPSVWQEPLGIVALEAMACGRAVIASAGGGLGEIVSGVGVTFPNGDFEALADGLIRLAENPGLREEAERKGAQSAKKCSIDVTGEMYLELYRNVLDRKRKHGESTGMRSHAWPQPE